MPAKKKKFIDKKNSVTFHLVHRSQKDPLQADEEAPQRVLLPLNDDQKKEIEKEQRKQFGIDFDDDYDYLQHLKDVDEINDVGPGVEVFRVPVKKPTKSNIKLSSQLFGSTVETDVGLLNKAAPIVGPQLDWDPEIVAALDDDFDFDEPGNQLDDDFIAVANSEEPIADTDISEPIADNPYKSKNEDEPDVWADYHANKDFIHGENQSDDESDTFSAGGSDVGSLESFGNEETKSQFTSYSMTSSVIRRNDGLTLLDERFEKMFADYDDNEMGAIEHEDIEGRVHQNSQVLNNLLDEFEADSVVVKLKDAVQQEPLSGTIEQQESSDSEHDETVMVALENPKEKWDCESILSTYSNLYNHPKQIVEPRRTKLKSERISQCTECEEPAPVIEKAKTIRDSDESAEDKRARKQQVKEERRRRREEKKGHKIAFKNEEMKQKKEQLNLKNSSQAIKL